MMESPDLGERHDLSEISVMDRPPFRRVLLKRQMRPGAVVVARVIRNHAAEMPLVEDDYVVQTLSAQGANKSLRTNGGSSTTEISERSSRSPRSGDSIIDTSVEPLDPRRMVFSEGTGLGPPC